MSIRSRIDCLERRAGLLKQQQCRPLEHSRGHHIDMAQRRMLASLTVEELTALHATVLAFQTGLELTREQETLALRCEEALEQERQRERDSTTSPSRRRIT